MNLYDLYPNCPRKPPILTITPDGLVISDGGDVEWFLPGASDAYEDESPMEQGGQQIEREDER